MIRPFLASADAHYLPQIGSLCDLLYPAPGNIIDWMYKKQGIKFTFAAHLRDTGTVSSVIFNSKAC